MKIYNRSEEFYIPLDEGVGLKYEEVSHRYFLLRKFSKLHLKELRTS